MLALLIDENFNHRILRGLLRTMPHLDYRLLPAAGLKGAEDPVVLDFASRESRVFATHDLRTVPKHAFDRVKSGLPMPGVIAVPDDLPVGRVIEDMRVIIECAAASEIQSLVFYLPL